MPAVNGMTGHRGAGKPHTRLARAGPLLALVALGFLAPGLRGSHAAVLPNDPLFATNQRYLLDIHAPDAWQSQTGDPRIVVAVLDAGVDFTHPDLAANAWTNPAPGQSGCSGDVHGCSFTDPGISPGGCTAPSPVRSGDVSPLNAHGTQVAGIIGAVGNNGVGIAGVAWRVGLMAVRVADCRGGADITGVVNGIHYAVDNGARVIDINVFAARGASAGCRTPDLFLTQAVQYARDHGVFVVAGAGDDNVGCVNDPAAVPGAFAVGGYQLPDRTRWAPNRTHGSNYGAQIAVAAPSADITGTVPRRPAEKPPDDLYAASSGTTLAAAIVAGEAALLLSQNSLLNPDWLSLLITDGARQLPDADTPGWAGAGAIDLAASLALVPAGYAGALTVAGASAPDGTLVEAYVGGVLCAQTASFSYNGQSTYDLLVPAAALQTGCGAPGAIVELRVGGVPVTRLPWSAAALALDLDAPAPQSAHSAAHDGQGGRVEAEALVEWRRRTGRRGAAAAGGV